METDVFIPNYFFVYPKLILHNKINTTVQKCRSVFCVFSTMIVKILDRFTGILFLEVEK